MPNQSYENYAQFTLNTTGRIARSSSPPPAPFRASAFLKPKLNPIVYTLQFFWPKTNKSKPRWIDYSHYAELNNAIEAVSSEEFQSFLKQYQTECTFAPFVDFKFSKFRITQKSTFRMPIFYLI